MTGADLAAAARELVGVRFRLHGRDPASGLDCLGVLAAALARCGRPAALPTGYSLRMRTLPDRAAVAAGAGLFAVTGILDPGSDPGPRPGSKPGDVLLVRCSPLQHHLLIAVGAGCFVHAHAGLRRVVVGPAEPGWTLVDHWRLR